MKEKKNYFASCVLFLLLLWFGIGNSGVGVVRADESTTWNGVDYEAIFDATYYAATYPDLAKLYGDNKQALLQHFVTVGMKEGRNGNSAFDLVSYIQNNVDLVEKYGDIDFTLYYWHYITTGRLENRICNQKDVLSKNRDQEVYDIMVSFKERFPEGMYWTNDQYYDWNGGTYYRGYGCAGFAFILSDAIFGEAKAVKHTDYSNIKVGDILRVNNDKHMVIVLEVHDDYVVVAEGNYNKSIHWGRIIPKEELPGEGDYVFTRYPL